VNFWQKKDPAPGAVTGGGQSDAPRQAHGLRKDANLSDIRARSMAGARGLTA
jgi:hypothetical protein